ncbi:hypothetical protein O3L50_004586 [Salmonella enterica]|uniref:Uncharacterized protein n=1 Tax=Salmonella enterica subsp. enterica serovar Javiana TaxID=363569 RepID=A0A607KBK3_SALET|nr:hypothetical protein [Salmonella enterica]EAR0120214.1 hypothetical protein [Salmonella enterica subsp. enterica serovar Javiana]EBF4799756.1 hypothetical protein [Salmonella enterica subsp. enterica]EDY0542909.1 hypothetical protein [Salmonella enterica subsp. enterica serovar Panama]EAN6964927.1 hypothetical protein [Salmonella enterica]
MTEKSLFTLRWSVLKPGHVPADMFSVLIDISAIRSEKVILALKAFFVDGKERGEICESLNVNAGYLSIKIRELQTLIKKIMSLYPFCNYMMKI